MFDYTTTSILKDDAYTIWSQTPFQPLTNGILSQFSASVLAEISKRAWYQYYDLLDFSPPPRLNIVRFHQGTPYLNLSLPGQFDAEQAMVEPLTLRVNNQLYPVCSWEKPGFLAGIKAGRNQKKIQTLLKKMSAEVEDICQEAAQWYEKTLTLRWHQSDILQVMEEIERIGAKSLTIFFAARHNLALAHNKLVRATLTQVPSPDNLTIIYRALSDVEALVERDMKDALDRLNGLASEDESIKAWLRSRAFTNWEESLPDGRFKEEFQHFLSLYGHRCTDEGEVCNPRWKEAPSGLFEHILASIQANSQHLLGTSSGGSPRSTHKHSPHKNGGSKLLESIDNKHKKEAQQILQTIRQLLQLQSQSLHAFSYIMAGTRGWAKAAATEAMSDSRLEAEDEVFYFEIEEIKEMMTGERNVSHLEEIRSSLKERRTQYSSWQNHASSELLLISSEREIEAKSTYPDAPTILQPIAIIHASETSPTIGEK